MPAALPFGWSSQKVEGRTVYVDSLTRRTTFTDPRLAFARESRSSGQQQFRQKWDASSTALQVLHGRDLSGKVAVVTGAGSGVGRAAARALAFHNCRVVAAGRAGAGERLAAELERERPGRKVESVWLELEDLAGVVRAAREIRSRHPRLDYLVLCAGQYRSTYTTTIDGLETMLLV